MLFVVYSDSTRFIIPNWLNGSLILLYPLAVWLSPVAVDWQMAIAAMLVMFAIGYVIFALNLMGGGDIKLITALALWVGWEKLAEFGFLFALLGGAMSLVIIIGRKLAPYIISKSSLPRLLRDKEPVPYGVAIAAAFLWMVADGKIPMVVL